MNKKRLLKIADIVDTIPTKNFKMDVWYKENCKTVGCAIGWACQDKGIRRAGLKMEKLTFGFFTPRYKDEEEFGAVAAFCGITYCQSKYLFSNEEYRSGNPKPSTVSKRIREFVNSGGKYAN